MIVKKLQDDDLNKIYNLRLMDNFEFEIKLRSKGYNSIMVTLMYIYYVLENLCEFGIKIF